MAADQISELRNAVEAKSLDQTQVAKLKDMLEKVAGTTKTATDSVRLQALAKTLKRPVL